MAKHDVKKGDLLIAEPFLGDPNFERSVVLLCEHQENGSFGFVLNQATDMKISDVLDDLDYSDFPVYIGGPVEQDTLHFIHRMGFAIEDTQEISPGLFWGGDFEQVQTWLQMGKISEEDLRFFVGYSGWTGGQLEHELDDDAWIISHVKSDFIFDTPSSQLWREVLRQMGGKHKVLSNYPIDPRLN